MIKFFRFLLCLFVDALVLPVIMVSEMMCGILNLILMHLSPESVVEMRRELKKAREEMLEALMTQIEYITMD